MSELTTEAKFEALWEKYGDLAFNIRNTADGKFWHLPTPVTMHKTKDEAVAVAYAAMLRSEQPESGPASELTTEQKLAALRERFDADEVDLSKTAADTFLLTVWWGWNRLVLQGDKSEDLVEEAYSLLIAPDRQRIAEGSELQQRIAELRASAPHDDCPTYVTTWELEARIALKDRRIAELEQQLAEVTAERDGLRNMRERVRPVLIAAEAWKDVPLGTDDDICASQRLHAAMKRCLFDVDLDPLPAPATTEDD